MNLEHVKQFPIEKYLEKWGIFPDRTKGSKAWYFSPFRDERTPSFVLDHETNHWYDFGEGFGGSILDLIMRMDNIDFNSALAKFKESEIHSEFHSSQRLYKGLANKRDRPERIKILNTRDIYRFSLKNYLLSRSIPVPLAQKYLKEVNYESAGRLYFSLGFRNDSGGYELRNQLPKGKVSSSPKDVTTIINPVSNDLAIFEGFFDFLSACVYYKMPLLEQNVIVMNSTALKDRTLAKAKSFDAIYLFLDNDNSGKQTTIYFQENLPNCHNMAEETYPHHKDFNDFLIYTKTHKK